MSDTWFVVLGVAGIILLVAANGLFVATEFSYIAVRRSRIEQLANGGQARARVLLASLRHLDSYIAATQLGITMAGLALGSVGEPVVRGLIEPPLEELLGPIAGTTAARTVSFVAAFALITAAVIVFGELAPKMIALQRAEATALWVSAPMAIFTRTFAPFVWLLNGAGRLVVRPFGISGEGEHNATLSAEELEIVIEASARAGMLSTSELLLARRALEFSEIQADQVMVPRTELIAIDVEAPLDAVIETVGRHSHSRYPVYEGDLDHLVGLLEVRDLLALVRRGGDSWRSLIRFVPAVPDSVSVEVAIAMMRERRAQMVVLVDEHGGTSGILTADEVLYRLLGRWLGARGETEDAVRALPAGNLLLSGLTTIADAEEATGVELAGQDYDTVGGFVMTRLGRIPVRDDTVEVAGYTFRVTKMDGRRIDRVLVVKRDRPPGEAGGQPQT